jgi:predicted DCC family thiol-disulfide oxidoreductase YuxK
MTPELAAACDDAVHVICNDGRVLRAGRAMLYILSELGWRRTAAFFSPRPNIWLVEFVYWILASNRQFFSRFLFRS